MRFSTHSFTLILSLALSSSAFAIDQLSLSRALKMANKQNFTIAQQKNSLQTEALSYRDSFEEMYLPNVSLEAGTSSALTLGQIPHSSASDFGADKQRGDPMASVGLNMGEYTVFNSFKDKMSFDIAKLGYEREKERMVETTRSVRSDVVEAYFRAKTEQDKLAAAKRSRKMAKALLRLVKSRARVGKASSSDASSAEVDVLSAQNRVNELVGSEQSARWQLNTLLRYRLDAKYQLSTRLRFRPLKLTTEAAMKSYTSSAPSILDATYGLKASETSLKLAKMNRLPLPTVSFSGIGIRYVRNDFGTTGLQTSTTGLDSGNIDLTASIYLSLPLVGPGGLFRQREVRQAYHYKEISRLSYLETKLRDESAIHSSILTTRQQEKSIRNLQNSLKNATKVLNLLTKQMRRGRVSRLEVRDALEQARETELTLKDEILYHLSSKLQLGNLIGSDQFIPGK